MEESFQLVRLSKENLDDFLIFHNRECDYGPCYCMYWWVDHDTWEERTETEKLLMRKRLVSQGVFDGYLLYRNSVPVAWCQCHPRDAFPHITERFELRPEGDVWAMTCFLVKRGQRHGGIMTELLDRVLADLRARGARAVEAYPRRLETFDELYAWNGPEQAFIERGFSFIKYAGNRCIYRYDFV